MPCERNFNMHTHTLTLTHTSTSTSTSTGARRESKSEREVECITCQSIYSALVIDKCNTALASLASLLDFASRCSYFSTTVVLTFFFFFFFSHIHWEPMSKPTFYSSFIVDSLAPEFVLTLRPVALQSETNDSLSCYCNRL